MGQLGCIMVTVDVSCHAQRCQRCFTCFHVSYRSDGKLSILKMLQVYQPNTKTDVLDENRLARGVRRGWGLVTDHRDFGKHKITNHRVSK